MPDNNEHLKSQACFVCQKALKKSELKYHKRVHLPVCPACIGSTEEKQKADSLLGDLADGFVCGCI